MKQAPIMKIMFCCIIVLMMSGCVGHSKDTSTAEEIMNSYMHKPIYEAYNQHKDHLLFSKFECNTWEEHGVYVVVISSDAQTVDGCVVFSEKGQLLKQTGITTITVEDPSLLLHLTEAELSSRYGSYHFDSGSGRYLPSYVTSQASILILNIENSVVEHVSNYHLIEGGYDGYGDY